MNLKSLPQDQSNAFLDLLVLGMYADGHLAGVENEQIGKTLRALGWDEPSDRDREFDASVTRVRQHSDSPEAITSHVKTLAAAFKTDTERREAILALEGVLRGDGKIYPREASFLQIARQAFA